MRQKWNVTESNKECALQDIKKCCWWQQGTKPSERENVSKGNRIGPNEEDNFAKGNRVWDPVNNKMS